MRLSLKAVCGKGMSREEYMDYLVSSPYQEVYEVKELTYALPEPARLFPSVPCAICGENTAEFGLRVQDGKLVCIDCYDAYEREGF
ncbi:MAG: hypothetical protein J5818_06005 [Eggerthellaceae bacterium]|nr:hypothetical protein [Eggerthellaceae bacterium]